MAKEAVLTPIDAEAVQAARTAALPNAHLLLIVETFEALADPTRARILYALIQQPLCVRDLAILVGVSESGVSHQLACSGNVVWSNRDAKAMSSTTRLMTTTWRPSSKKPTTTSIMCGRDSLIIPSLSLMDVSTPQETQQCKFFCFYLTS